MERKSVDPLRQLPGYVLRRASVSVMGQLAERLAPLGLRQVEATILLVLGERPGMSQSALGRLLGIKRANMTPLAARLEEQGLILRQASDGRSLGLELSEKGADLAGKVRLVIDAHEQALLDRIPAEHQAHLLPVLLALWGDQDAD
jgi:DNA-binding MarR family transcriptional regulator